MQMTIKVVQTLTTVYLLPDKKVVWLHKYSVKLCSENSQLLSK